VEREIVKEIFGPLVLETWQRRCLCKCREMDAINVLKPIAFYMHHIQQNFEALLFAHTVVSCLFLRLSPSIPIFPSNIEGAWPYFDKFQWSSLACTWKFLAEN
jgi:hypothetical protein